MPTRRNSGGRLVVCSTRSHARVRIATPGRSSSSTATPRSTRETSSIRHPCPSRSSPVISSAASWAGPCSVTGRSSSAPTKAWSSGWASRVSRRCRTTMRVAASSADVKSACIRRCHDTWMCCFRARTAARLATAAPSISSRNRNRLTSTSTSCVSITRHQRPTACSCGSRTIEPR